MANGKIVPIEDRIPKLKQKRKKRANRLFVMYIIIFFILILGILYFQSPLSNIAEINVEGNLYVEEDEIIKKSGLVKGGSFWKVDLSEAQRAIEDHKEISSAVINRQYPNSFMIKVKENKRIGYVMEESSMYPILDSGYILRQNSNNPGDAPIFVNWKDGEQLQEMASQLTKIPKEISNLISEVHYDPIQTDPMHIKLFMNDGNEVSATIRNFSEKIITYPSIVNNIPEGTKGIVDLEVGYFFKPYENHSEKEDDDSESER